MNPLILQAIARNQEPLKPRACQQGAVADLPPLRTRVAAARVRERLAAARARQLLRPDDAS